MTQCSQFAVGLLTLAAALVPATGIQAASDPAPVFRIMSDDEIAAHSTVMQNLHGQAREEYRNAQYAQLRQRALDNGYRMPADPPWLAQAAQTAAPAGPGTAADSAASEAAARHAAMREKLDARRDPQRAISGDDLARLQQAIGVQQVPEAQPQNPPAESAQPAAPAMPAAVEPQAAAEVSSTPLEPATPGPAAAPEVAVEAVEAAQPAEPAPQPATVEPPAPPPATAETRFVPAEELAELPEQAPPPPATPTPPEAPAAPAAPEMPERASAGIEAAGPAEGGETVEQYRASMRARFDEYMQERQARHDDMMRRQREQLEANMEQSRAKANRMPPQPYPYPGMPAYGPRYPAAFPGYRTPYWQQ